ncbi:MFS transporter [Sporomusa acidovorans]|uniref:Sulfoacetate transporter SauU n=1 Tax=Sporomusa acidovorans (strain ATCC 49682 / DSM 3132 / Mol) TaxID=1123286 RepID=A0ABZ3IX60_SPOA4|nr:MFS transporter [Sporomusa acidovorans]OZC13051.1 putative sulfoacetate transporter SauU [Sporomusa acidovorans DSM 3132]SDF51114.1 Sugar phosphate permease [Sporomusa acidovorans]
MQNTPMQPVAQESVKTKQRLVLAAILLFTVMVAYFDRVNISVLVVDNEFLSDMGIKGQPVQIGMLMTGFLIAYGLGNLTLSSLGDYIGPRKTMCIAMVLWGFSMFWGGIAQFFTMMLISRFVLGLGEGMHFPMQSTFVKKWFPRQERARANACWFIGTSLAPALAMPVFVWIVSHMGWRSSFFICAVVGLLPLYLIWFHTADTPRQHKKVNALELQYIEAGLTEDGGVKNTAVHASVGENIKTVAGNYRFWLLVIYYAAHNFVYWGLLTWLPTYLKTARGFSWKEMGFLASLPFILSIICKVIAGVASDYVGRRAPFCVIATLGSAIGIYFTGKVVDNYSAAALICFGMGVLTLGAPMVFTMLQELLPDRAISLGTGTMNGLSFFFASLGPVMIGFFIGLTGGFAGALYLLVGMSLIGMTSALILALQKY